MVKGIKIKLLDSGLIRRFGSVIINVDPSIAMVFIKKDMAKCMDESDYNLLFGKKDTTKISIDSVIGMDGILENKNIENQKTIFPKSIIKE